MKDEFKNMADAQFCLAVCLTCWMVLKLLQFILYLSSQLRTKT